MISAITPTQLYERDDVSG